MPAQILDERRGPRALLLQPFHLVGAAVRVGVDPLRILIERLVARAGIREPPHGHAANAVRALGILVRPRRVVARAGRQHVNIVLRREPLRHEPAQVLGSAEDLRSVSLNDERQFHSGCCSMWVNSPTIRLSPKSWRRRRCPAITSALRLSSNASAARSSAACSRSFGANWTPAPPSVSGTAAAAYARIGTSAAIASTRGTQKPSCSLSET